MDVELPDGTVIEDVPEGTTKTDLMSRIMKARAQGMDVGPKNEQDAARWAPPSLPMRTVKQAAHGLIEGTYGAARDIGAMVPFGPAGPIPPFLVPDQVKNAVGDKIKEILPHTSEVNNLLTRLGLDITVPPAANAAEEYIDPMARLGGAMLPGPAAKAGSMYGSVMRWLAPMAKRGAAGAVAGAAGQGAREISGDYQAQKFVPRPDIAGSTAEIASLLLPMLAMRRPSNESQVLTPLLASTSEDTLRAASARAQRAGTDLGTRSMLPQGLDQRGQVQGLMEAILGSPGSGQAHDIVGEQLAAAMPRAKAFAESPTTAATGYKEANDIAKVAKRAIEDPSRIRTDVTRPLYDLTKTEAFSTQEVKAMLADLEQARTSHGMLAGTEEGKALIQVQNDLIKSLQEGLGTPAKYNKAGVKIKDEIPPVTITSDVIARHARDAGLSKDALFTGGKHLGSAKAYELAQEMIRAKLQGGNYPAWEAANAEFTRLSQAVEEMGQSPMTTMFSKKQLKTGKGNFEPWSAMILNPHVEADSIRNIAQSLRPHGAEAFPTMVKKAWTDTLELASGEVGGWTPQLAAGSFAKNIAGAPGSKMREKFYAIIDEMGMDRGTADRMIETFETISRGREGVGSISPKWFGEASGANPLSAALRTPGGLVGASPAAAALERVKSAKTVGRIVELFTDPKWIDEVVRISKYSQIQRDFQTALVGMMGLEGAHRGGPGSPLPEDIVGKLYTLPGHVGDEKLPTGAAPWGMVPSGQK